MSRILAGLLGFSLVMAVIGLARRESVRPGMLLLWAALALVAAYVLSRKK